MHDNLCFPLRRAYLLLFLQLYFYVESTSLYSNLKYSPLGKHHVVGKDPGTYIQLNIYDHELLLLTIIFVISKLGGETLNPHLPLCPMETVCSKNML